VDSDSPPFALDIDPFHSSSQRGRATTVLQTPRRCMACHDPPDTSPLGISAHRHGQ
jgi:hypothetical protein